MNILSATNFDPCNIDVKQIFDGDFEQDADAFNIAVPPKSITSSWTLFMSMCDLTILIHLLRTGVILISYLVSDQYMVLRPAS